MIEDLFTHRTTAEAGWRALLLYAITDVRHRPRSAVAVRDLHGARF